MSDSGTNTVNNAPQPLKRARARIMLGRACVAALVTGIILCETNSNAGWLPFLVLGFVLYATSWCAAVVQLIGLAMVLLLRQVIPATWQTSKKDALEIGLTNFLVTVAGIINEFSGGPYWHS